jgi:hypothetical protein
VTPSDLRSIYPALKPQEHRTLTQCRYCYKEFFFVSEHLIHLEKHVPDVESVAEMTLKIWLPDRKLRCDRCKNKTSYTLAYARHSDTHPVPGLCCQECRAEVESPKEYGQHMKIHHPSVLFSEGVVPAPPQMSPETLPAAVIVVPEAQQQYSPVVAAPEEQQVSIGQQQQEQQIFQQGEVSQESVPPLQLEQQPFQQVEVRQESVPPLEEELHPQQKSFDETANAAGPDFSESRPPIRKISKCSRESLDSKPDTEMIEFLSEVTEVIEREKDSDEDLHKDIDLITNAIAAGASAGGGEEVEHVAAVDEEEDAASSEVTASQVEVMAKAAEEASNTIKRETSTTMNQSPTQQQQQYKSEEPHHRRQTTYSERPPPAASAASDLILTDEDADDLKLRLSEDDEDEDEEQEVMKHSCPKCGDEYTSANSLKIHSLNCSKDINRCDLCNQSFMSSTSLKMHRFTCQRKAASAAAAASNPPPLAPIARPEPPFEPVQRPPQPAPQSVQLALRAVEKSDPPLQTSSSWLKAHLDRIPSAVLPKPKPPPPTLVPVVFSSSSSSSSSSSDSDSDSAPPPSRGLGLANAAFLKSQSNGGFSSVSSSAVEPTKDFSTSEDEDDQPAIKKPTSAKLSCFRRQPKKKTAPAALMRKKSSEEKIVEEEVKVRGDQTYDTMLYENSSGGIKLRLKKQPSQDDELQEAVRDVRLDVVLDVRPVGRATKPEADRGVRPDDRCVRALGSHVRSEGKVVCQESSGVHPEDRGVGAVGCSEGRPQAKEVMRPPLPQMLVSPPKPASSPLLLQTPKLAPSPPPQREVRSSSPERMVQPLRITVRGRGRGSRGGRGTRGRGKGGGGGRREEGGGGAGIMRGQLVQRSATPAKPVEQNPEQKEPFLQPLKLKIRLSGSTIATFQADETGVTSNAKLMAATRAEQQSEESSTSVSPVRPFRIKVDPRPPPPPPPSKKSSLKARLVQDEDRTLKSGSLKMKLPSRPTQERNLLKISVSSLPPKKEKRVVPTSPAKYSSSSSSSSDEKSSVESREKIRLGLVQSHSNPLLLKTSNSAGYQQTPKAAPTVVGKMASAKEVINGRPKSIERNNVKVLPRSKFVNFKTAAVVKEVEKKKVNGHMQPFVTTKVSPPSPPPKQEPEPAVAAVKPERPKSSSSSSDCDYVLSDDELPDLAPLQVKQEEEKKEDTQQDQDVEQHQDKQERKRQRQKVLVRPSQLKLRRSRGSTKILSLRTRNSSGSGCSLKVRQSVHIVASLIRKTPMMTPSIIHVLLISWTNLQTGGGTRMLIS